MSVTINAYSKKCKVTNGGIKRAYIFPYVEYSRSEIRYSGMELIQFPNSNIYQFDCEGSYNQSSNLDEGSISFDQNINLQLSEVYEVLDIHDFLKTDFRVIIETENKQNIMFGVRNGMTCRTSNTTGTTKNEFNGFTLDFTGKEEKTGLFISDLGSLGLTIIN